MLEMMIAAPLGLFERLGVAGALLYVCNYWGGPPTALTRWSLTDRATSAAWHSPLSAFGYAMATIAMKPATFEAPHCR